MLYHEINHLQTFLHDFFLPVGDPLDQDGDIVIQNLLVLPDVLIVPFQLVLKGNRHLLDVLCSLVTLGVSDDQ